MKKIWKKVLASVLAVTLCVGAFMTTNWNVASAEDATSPTASLEVSGASIRFINENTAVDGIRFAVRISVDVFNTLTDAQKKNYHLLVMPTALIGTDGELKQGETYEYTVGSETKYAYAQDISIDWAGAKEESGYKVVRIYLNEIDASYYTTDITARAYYQDGSTAPVYSAAIDRSYYVVADAALNDLSDTVDEVYDNQVGSKYSRHDATQRDALLGVKYEKTGTWDYVDGQLVTNGSVKTEANTYIHPMVIDRNAGTNSSNYVIETSFDVGVSDDTAFVGKADNTDTAMKGFVFAYDETTKGYYLLDFRYRAPAGLKEGWYPYIRYYTGSGWSTTIGKGSPIDAGWSDFRIAVNATGTTTELSVEYKKQGEDIYTTIINSRTVGTDAWADGTKITGSKVGFYSTLPNQTIEFDSEVKISDNTVQTRGNSSVKLDQKLADDGTGTIKGSFVVDYRTSGDRSKHEGIKFSGTNGNGYTFFVSSHNFNPQTFYIGMWRNVHATPTTGTTWSNTDMSLVQKGSDGTNGVASIPAISVMNSGNITVKENEEILVDFEIQISIENGAKIFEVDYALSHNGVKRYECTGWKVKDSDGDRYTGGDVYLMSEDTGVENTTAQGDGKTMFYPITVTAPTVVPVTKYEVTTGTATLTQLNNGVKLTQAGGGQAFVKDLETVLPNKTNFTIEVDMSPVYSTDSGFINMQGISVGGRQVVIGNDRVGVFDGTWTGNVYLYNTEFPEVATALKSNPFTFIVTVSGNTLTIGVRVNGVETTLKQHVLKNGLVNNTLHFYSSTDKIATTETVERTFSNVRFVDVEGYVKTSTDTGTIAYTSNGFSITNKDAGTWTTVQTKYHVFPMTDDVTISVDMNPVAQNGVNVVHEIQPFSSLQIRLCNNGSTNYLQLYNNNGWVNYLESEGNATFPTDFENQAYTFLVRIYKSGEQNLLDVSVKIGEQVTVIKSGVVITASPQLKNLLLRASLRSNYADGVTTTFSNVTVTDNTK